MVFLSFSKFLRAVHELGAAHRGPSRLISSRRRPESTVLGFSRFAGFLRCPPGIMIIFRSGEMTHIKASVPLKILITNTMVGRNTKALVVGVSKKISRHPDVMASGFCVVDLISKEFASIIESPALDDDSICAKEDKIEELMEMNQGLLESMGVCHSSIETVLRTTPKYRLASKLISVRGEGWQDKRVNGNGPRVAAKHGG